MNKILLTRKISFFAVCTLLLTITGPRTAFSQNTREDMCNNNEKKMIELRREISQKLKELPWGSDEQLARAELTLKSLRSDLSAPAPEDFVAFESWVTARQVKISDLSTQYGFDFSGECIINFRFWMATCYNKFLLHIERLISNAKNMSPRRKGMLQSIAELEKQIAWHRGRMIELKCGEKGVSPCGLGRVWDEVESGFHMTLTRQGESNVFKVLGNVKGQVFTAEQTITITGNKVAINRYQASDGNTCTFEGTIQSDGVSVSGTYKCTKYNPTSGWSATIKCN